MRWLFLAVLLAAWAGCKSGPARESPHRDMSARADHEGPRVVIPQGTTPVLKTDEVLRIAQETSRTRHFRMEDYECDMILYQFNATNRAKPGTWLLHFVTRPPVPDMDYSVEVDDGSGKAVLRVR